MHHCMERCHVEGGLHEVRRPEQLGVRCLARRCTGGSPATSPRCILIERFTLDLNQQPLCSQARSPRKDLLLPQSSTILISVALLRSDIVKGTIDRCSGLFLCLSCVVLVKENLFYHTDFSEVYCGVLWYHFTILQCPSGLVLLQHTWSKWMGRYQASAELDDHLNQVCCGRETSKACRAGAPRTSTEDHCNTVWSKFSLKTKRMSRRSHGFTCVESLAWWNSWYCKRHTHNLIRPCWCCSQNVEANVVVPGPSFNWPAMF